MFVVLSMACTAVQPWVVARGDPTSRIDLAYSALASARDELGPTHPVDWRAELRLGVAGLQSEAACLRRAAIGLQGALERVESCSHAERNAWRSLVASAAEAW